MGKSEKSSIVEVNNWMKSNKINKEAYKFKNYYCNEDYKDAEYYLKGLSEFCLDRLTENEKSLIISVIGELENYLKRLVELDKLMDEK